MIAIIDTSALITLYMLDKVENLHIIFGEVYVPLMVEKEFLKDDTDERFKFLLNFYETNYWFKKCQAYHNDIIEILRTNKKIHDGEREAIAQYKRLQVDLLVEEGGISCLIDDKEARTVAQGMDIRVNGTLYFLARLHFEGFINYHKEINLLKEERRYSDKVIKEAFEKVKIELGLS
jgi:predicted nucleic acid-binding protein